MLRGKPPIRRVGDGRYRVELAAEERQLLHDLAEQVTELLTSTDSPGLHRSFPPAYRGVDHADRAEEYRTMMTPELAERHRESLATLRDCAQAEELDGGQMEGWVRALNQIRLVLGTQLGLEGNDDELPDTMEAQVYEYLIYVQSLVIEALSA